MKQFLSVVLCLFIISTINAQKMEDAFICTNSEQTPKFPGGDAELYRFIANNLNYPALAIENDIQGRVVVRLIIRKDGSVGDIMVVRSVDRILDNEAIRICMKLPKFIPGKQNGKPIDAWYTIPITFRL